MYMSPLMLLVLEPAFVGDEALGAGLAVCMFVSLSIARDGLRGSTGEPTLRIGGTSTCCIPFFAWIEALIRAAAAAIKTS